MCVCQPPRVSAHDDQWPSVWSAALASSVLKLCRSEKAGPPSVDALEYLAVEFVRLTSERQTP